MIIIVDLDQPCRACPFLGGGGEPADGGIEFFCGADDDDNELEYCPKDGDWDSWPPDWCPLKQEDSIMVCRKA